MADKADCSVVWYSCKCPFFGKVITMDSVYLIGHSPVFKIRLAIMASPPALTCYAGMLSTQLTSRSSVLWLLLQPHHVWGYKGVLRLLFVGSQVLLDRHQLYRSEQYSVHQLRISDPLRDTILTYLVLL